ncbi:MAG TPA: poly-gamma-glutamate hydrolase family protein [Ilumatobacteraceae bacterium]|nr:poly-gamma-glutamate hydrolase family protein [Ilumatobacteraceae bacterium]
MSTDPFSELLAMPGVTEVCELRGPIGFMAYHGGRLEAQTDVIASLAAERSGSSYYAVLQPEEVQWHIPSHKFSPSSSPRMKTFLEHVDTVITIHGFGHRDHFTSLLLGGRNRELAEHVAGHLRPRLLDYDVITNLERIPKDLRGLPPDNPVNLPARQGVQIELPPRIRGSSPIWADWDHSVMVPPMAALIDGLVDAAEMWVTEPTAR